MYIGIIYPLYVFTFYSRELGNIDAATPGTKTFPTFRAQKTNKDIATSVRVLLNTLINRLNLDCDLSPSAISLYWDRKLLRRDGK